MDISVSLSNTNSYTNYNSTCASTNSSLTAKLRRLKIEESILLQSIKNNKSQNKCDGHNHNYLIFAKFKKFLDHTKTTFKTLKRLFQDMKACTSSKEEIKSLEIDDIKKNILELENNMKSFKIHVQKELTALKAAERELNQKLNDPMTIKNLKRKPRVQTAKYTEIVQSPVKTLMTSPLKNSEVHEFQEFMKNSKNRYGGWDEYHHNIFVNMWQKNFNRETPFASVSTIEKVSEFNFFIRELLPKLKGVSEEEIISHINWYTKYLYLKDLQQKAIDEWRSNKRKMKKSHSEKKLEEHDNFKIKSIVKKKYTRMSTDDINYKAEDGLIHQDDLKLENGETQFSVKFTRKCISDEMRQECITNKGTIYNEEYAGSDEKTKLHFLKTTKQWHIRCCSENLQNENQFSHIENIQKLGTPLWRAGL